MTDFVESALRNCNAALQNSSMQALFGRSFRNSGKIKRHGNRSQTFGTASDKFYGIAQIKGKSLQDFSGKFPEMQDDIHSSRKLAAALLAGLIAIVANTAMLEAARLDRSSPPEAAS